MPPARVRISPTIDVRRVVPPSLAALCCLGGVYSCLLFFSEFRSHARVVQGHERCATQQPKESTQPDSTQRDRHSKVEPIQVNAISKDRWTDQPVRVEK